MKEFYFKYSKYIVLIASLSFIASKFIVEIDSMIVDILFIFIVISLFLPYEKRKTKL